MPRFLRCIRTACLLAGILWLNACQSPGELPFSSPEGASDYERLEEILAASVANWNTADIDALMEGTADGFVMMGPGVPAQIGKETLRASWEEYLAGHTDIWNPVVEDIQVSGDLAFIRSSFTTTTTSKADGTTSETKGKTIVILKRQGDGEWRHIVEIWNRDDEPDRE